TYWYIMMPLTIIGKDEAIQFLLLLKYLETLPSHPNDADYCKTAKQCLLAGLVSITPDGNYLISAKGWALLDEK
ncbi:MAG TPA: hypothetical protein VIM89_03960, partial [Mucilaginibacter sp.]